jgi:hypothetical protein
MTNLLIYSLHEPDTGEIRYVGKTERGQVRLDEQCRMPATKDRSHRAKWVRALHRDGLRPVCSIIEFHDTSAALDAAEIMWIADVRASGARLTNHASGGGSGRLDEATKAKISAANKGRLGWNKGKKFPNLSGVNSPLFGKPLSVEHREKISLTRKARTHCKRGHEFTPENTGVATRGNRRCKTCDREAQRAVRESETGRPTQVFNRNKTHCKHGHEYTSANTIVRPNGSRNCRCCLYAAVARYQARKALVTN